MKYVAPHASFGYKLILGNLWLFSSILSSILSKGSTDAIQRTTTAVTIIRGGIKSNVLPSEASAVVNHRIHPADTIETVIAQDVSELTPKGAFNNYVDKMRAGKGSKNIGFCPH